MNSIKIIAAFIVIILFSINAYSQTVIQGIVLDSTGNPLIGAEIRDCSNKIFRVGTITDINGRFRIELKSDASLMKISFLGFETQLIKIDTIVDKLNFKCTLNELNQIKDEVFVIAPRPHAFELGYFGLSSHLFGSHIEYYSRADNYHAYLNYAKDGKGNNYSDFELGPYRLGSYEEWKFYRPFCKVLISNLDSRFLLCNEFGLINRGLIADLGLDVGIGMEINNDKLYKMLFLSGIQKHLNLPFYFFESYFKFDFMFNNVRREYQSALYIELYNRNYRKLTFNIGYQSVFNNKDFILGVNYKYYIFKRKASAK